jgi:hypothetical protein
MKKTYNVMNRGSETSLVYLVASKCGLVGLIHWGIKVFFVRKILMCTWWLISAALYATSTGA